MIIVMEKGASKDKVQHVLNRLEAQGFKIHLSEGVEKTIIGAVGERSYLTKNNLDLEALPGVEKVVPILSKYKLASRDFHSENTVIKVGDLEIGGDKLHIMAGPCAIEGRDEALEVAEIAAKGGAKILRGGAFKPRTSPYDFQGLKEEGLKYMKEAGEQFGLKIISEVVDTRDVDLVAEYVDIIQIGARNMQNFALLMEVARTKKPVLLKRGLSSTIEEWIMASEYILNGGNPNVMFCERGIRTFETMTRNTLDLSAVPLLKSLTHLPVIVDPSHGTGKWKLVSPMSKAAVACGADGLIIEVHPNPECALSDGPQSLTSEKYYQLMSEIGSIAAAIGRKI